MCLSAALPLQAQESKRVLLLFSNESLLPAGQALTGSIQSTLNAGTEEHLEFFPEYLDFVRFSEPGHEARMVEYLRGKYGSIRFDLTFAIGPEALSFTVEHRAELSLQAPVVFTGIREGTLRTTALPADVVGTTFQLDPVRTLDLALQLQPDIQHVVVVTGAAPFDRKWEATARAGYQEYEKRLDFIYLSGLPMPELLRQVANLPERSVVVYFSVFLDGAGTQFYGRDVAKLISTAANAPVYSLYDTYLGLGIVGGYMSRFEDLGNSAAGIALRILAGESPANASLHRARYRRLHGRFSAARPLEPQRCPPAAGHDRPVQGAAVLGAVSDRICHHLCGYCRSRTADRRPVVAAPAPAPRRRTSAAERRAHQYRCGVGKSGPLAARPRHIPHLGDGALPPDSRTGSRGRSHAAVLHQRLPPRRPGPGHAHLPGRHRERQVL